MPGSRIDALEILVHPPFPSSPNYAQLGMNSRCIHTGWLYKLSHAYFIYKLIIIISSSLYMFAFSRMSLQRSGGDLHLCRLVCEHPTDPRPNAPSQS